MHNLELTLPSGQRLHGLCNQPASSSPGYHTSTGRHRARVLCLHGWLDNAASFLPIAPYLNALDVVAIDLPGHGRSDHAPAGGYTLFEMSIAVRQAISALGWPACHLVGHSLGGCIAAMLAVADASVVTSLALIEASGPLSEEADALPARLARALEDRLATGRFRSRVFSTPSQATASRLRATRMSETSARLIIERQLELCDGGFQWRFDPALRNASAQYQTEAQVLAMLRALRMPVLSVVADDGYLSSRHETRQRLAATGDGRSNRHRIVRLPGDHHLHMDAPEPVADALRDFLTVT